MVANEDDRQRANWTKLEHFKEVLVKLGHKVLQRGFYGKVWIDAKIQDGVIQYTAARVEETMK